MCLATPVHTLISGPQEPKRTCFHSPNYGKKHGILGMAILSSNTDLHLMLSASGTEEAYRTLQKQGSYVLVPRLNQA